MLAPEEIFEGKGDVKEEGELTQAERKRRRANKKRRYAGVFCYAFQRNTFPLTCTLRLLLITSQYRKMCFTSLVICSSWSIEMIFCFPFSLEMQGHTRRGQSSCRKIRLNVSEPRTACMPCQCPRSLNIESWKGSTSCTGPNFQFWCCTPYYSLLVCHMFRKAQAF